MQTSLTIRLVFKNKISAPIIVAALEVQVLNVLKHYFLLLLVIQKRFNQVPMLLTKILHYLFLELVLLSLQ